MMSRSNILLKHEEKMSLEELIENFSLDGISKSPSIFDETKMKWLSGEYIKAMTQEEFKERAYAFLKQSKSFGKYDEDKLLSLVKGRVQIFSEIAEKALSNRFDIKIAKQNIDIAEKELKLVASQKIPDLKISGGYGFIQGKYTDNGSLNNGAYVGASLINIPVFYNYPHQRRVANAYYRHSFPQNDIHI